MLSEQFPNEYNAWINAGGIENNFRAHLLGIGVLQPTNNDLAFLVEQMQASSNQVRNLVTNHPFVLDNQVHSP